MHFERNLNNSKQMIPVAYAYINKRECSVQECVYYILSGQWLRKTFSGVVFVNSNLPEKRNKIFLIEDQISELSQESTSMFKK